MEGTTETQSFTPSNTENHDAVTDSQVAEAMSDINKRALLAKFIEDNLHRPVQGSEDWLRERQCSFGGSELACLFGLNRYRKKKDGIIEKILQAYEGGISSIAMSWGTLFEDVHRRYMEKVLGTEVFETGAIPCPITAFHKYSPDGLCVVDREVVRKVICNPESLDGVADSELLLLLEQKQVTTRKIKPGAIPEYYLPQIKGGLCTISFTEFGLYTECNLSLLRSSSLRETHPQRSFSIFSRFGEPRYFPEKMSGAGFARGTVVIRSNDPAFLQEQRAMLEANLVLPGKKEVYEALDVKCDALHRCIMAWARHPKVQIDRETYFDSQEEFSGDAGDVLLVIPWVIKELNMVGVPKDPEYLSRKLGTIDTAGNFLRKTHQWITEVYPQKEFLSDPAEKKKLVDKISEEYDAAVSP